jgi:hypothetical protein
MGSKFQFTTTLPRRRYNLTDYPNLDPDTVGRVIPIGYGTLAGLPPTKLDGTIDSRTQWKILDQALAEITAMHSATTATMVKDVDYEEDLANGGFYLLKAHRLTPSTTFRFAIEADYAVSASNYMSLARNNGSYADGVAYSINGSGTWNGDALGNDLRFEIYGKTALGATETLIYDNSWEDGVTTDIGLKDSSLRTKVGQSFKTAASVMFITRIVVYGTVHGTLSGKYIRATLYDSILDQVGIPSQWVSTDDGLIEIGFYPQNEDETLLCDVKAPGTELNKVATILPDVITNVMGRATSHLDATELANLATDRDQVLKIFLGDTIQFGDFVAKLEAGQLWKLVPKQDGNHMTVVEEAGEPGNTLILYDHELSSLKMEYDSSVIKESITVFYDQDEAVGDYLAVQASSQIARFFYLNETELTVETYHGTLSGATWLTGALKTRYEVPVIRATFEIHAKGIELLPFRDKVKLYKTRAPYAGGTLNGVLMRIVSLTKRPEDNVVQITACVWGNSAV